MLHVFIRGYDRADIVGNNSLLPTFVLKGNRGDGQGLEPSLDVDFWATSNKYMQIRNLKMQANKILDKFKDRLSWGGHPKVGTLIERIHNDEKWVLGRSGKHLLQMVDQYTIAGLVHPLPMCRIETVDDIATGL